MKWDKLRAMVYLRDQGACWICQEHVADEDYELGHLVERVAGGADTADNVAVMCRTCNRIWKPIHDSVAAAFQWREGILRQWKDGGKALPISYFLFVDAEQQKAARLAYQDAERARLHTAAQERKQQQRQPPARPAPPPDENPVMYCADGISIHVNPAPAPAQARAWRELWQRLSTPLPASPAPVP